MEEIGISRLEGMGNSVRRKRSQTIRRPRPDPIQKFPEIHDHSSPTPPSDDTSKVSSDEPTGCDINSRRKEFNLNQCTLRGSFSREGDLEESGLNHQRYSDGVLAPSHSRNNNKVRATFELHSGSATIHGGRNGEIESIGRSRLNGDGAVSNEVKKVKLKVGGVTRSFQTASNAPVVSGSGSSKKSSLNSDAPRARQKLILQDNSDDDFPLNKSNHAREISLTDFTRGNNSSCGKEEFSAEKMPDRSTSGKQDTVRKSKRVPKKRLLSDAFDEEDEDDEIRYLEKLKYSKVAAGRKEYEEESSKKQRVSRVSKNRISEDFVSKKSGSERGSEDTHDEEEAVSDGDPESKKKKLRTDSVDSPTESKREQALTTRQRALLSSKDASASGASVIEFPNGLPPAPPRKQKEKLTEVEQQLKKAEAAQRRKLQVEKAARESEAEAIRKILGQDSSRKKKEDKLKKRQEELAQERAANALTLPSNTIRLVMNPTGTVVTFSNDMGLPSIFDSKPCSYPPPREKCAGPSCCNPFKYRDSKSKLPLCSLQCYKAIHANMQAEEATTSTT